MTYDEWEGTVPEVIKADRIWRVQAFRLASYLSACVESDSLEIEGDAKVALLLAQLRRAAASVAANIAEGYPRRSTRDRVRFYEYALGSAEETKSWYFSLRASVDSASLEARLSVLRSITRLLLTMIRSSRPHSPSIPSPP
jgi:four helix bundle protein